MPAFTRKICQQKDSYVVTIPKDIMIKNRWRVGDNICFSITNDGTSLRRDEARPLFTIGYEGMSIDNFVGKLSQKGIEMVIDVRQNAISRKNGFSKKALQKALMERNIEYINPRELGAPKQLRDELKANKKIDIFLKKYSDYFQNNLDSFEKILKISRNKNTTLVCYEKEWLDCHRRVIAEEYRKEGFVVKHI